MSYAFGGTSSEVLWTIGGIDGTGGWTFAVLVKFDAGVSWQGMLNLENSGTHRVGIERMGSTGNLASVTNNGANTQDSGIAISSADGWQLLAAARPAGANQVVRFTKYPIGGSPSHANGPTDQDNSAASNNIMFGNTQNADFFDGRLAACAYWDTNLSDGQMEGLVTTMTRAGWLATGTPKFLADANNAFQTDYAGTSTRSSISDGTDDPADNPAGWASWAPAAGGGLAWIRA